MSKPIKLFVIYDTDSGVVCQHEKSAFNIENLFKYIDCRPNREDVDTQRCLEHIVRNGSMFVYLGSGIKKFHFSRESLMKEVNHYRMMDNVIQSI